MLPEVLYLEPYEIMECLGRIVYTEKPLTIFAKLSILDV